MFIASLKSKFSSGSKSKRQLRPADQGSPRGPPAGPTPPTTTTTAMPMATTTTTTMTTTTTTSRQQRLRQTQRLQQQMQRQRQLLRRTPSARPRFLGDNDDWFLSSAEEEEEEEEEEVEEAAGGQESRMGHYASVAFQMSESRAKEEMSRKQSELDVALDLRGLAAQLEERWATQRRKVEALAAELRRAREEAGETKERYREIRTRTGFKKQVQWNSVVVNSTVKKNHLL